MFVKIHLTGPSLLAARTSGGSPEEFRPGQRGLSNAEGAFKGKDAGG
jgi:hypothetical protein